MTKNKLYGTMAFVFILFIGMLAHEPDISARFYGAIPPSIFLVFIYVRLIDVCK